MGETSQTTDFEAPTIPTPRWWRQAPVIAWAVVSVAFLAFIVLGTVPARIWRLGLLHVDTKSIAGTWEAQMRNLPDQSSGWFMQTAFAGSLVVFVVAVLIGFRLLLIPDKVEEG